MDEKNQNKSESQMEQELSAGGDSVTENTSEQNNEILEAVTGEYESANSEIKAPPLDDHSNDDTIPVGAESAETAEKGAEIESTDTPFKDGSEAPVKSAGETETKTDETVEATENQAEIEPADETPEDDSETATETETETEMDPVALQADKGANKDSDDPETVSPPDEAHDEDGQESTGPDPDREHDTLQLNSSDGDGPEETAKEAQSGNEDYDLYEKRAVTEEKETEKAIKANASDNEEVEEIKGSSEEQTAIEEIDETLANNEEVEGDDPAAHTQNESETAEADEETDDLAEENSIETPTGKISALKVAVSAIIIAAVFSGFFFFDNKAQIKGRSQKASKTSEKRVISENRVKKKMIKRLTPKISSIYNAKIEEVTALRDSLLLKQEEVMRLKKHYRDGIEELEKEISDESQKRQCKTFFQAIENNSIAFALRTIQRKEAYIQQLERPSKWIHQACEELLYIKRRTLMDLEVDEIVAGIDMNKHVRRIDAAVRKYQPDADKLAPEMTNAQLEPLETIWERIQKKTQQYASVGAYSKNQIISEQICTGDFNRLTELSEISSETARCITEMQGSDLFLNSVSEISPGAARQLIYWKGSWICLNGIRALSLRAAHYLFQWDGNWISLNGLTEFPAEIGETLLQWQGRQLELMGLQYIEDFPAKIAFEYLARWERAGGKLFVPKSVRKKIDEIHRKSI